jgi:hypothetical protein
MEDKEIESTKKLFEIFIDHTEIKELIDVFFSDIVNNLNEKTSFPNLDSIVNKTLTHQTLFAKIKEDEEKMQNYLFDFSKIFKNEVFSKYNIYDLENFIKESFGYLFNKENFINLRKYPQNRFKKIIYEDNSLYTGQVIKNNYGADARDGLGIFEIFPAKDVYLGLFQNDNFLKGVMIKNTNSHNNFFIGNFQPLDRFKTYRFEGITIAKSNNKIAINIGSVNIKDEIAKGYFFLIENNKFQFFKGELLSDEKSCENGVLISFNECNSAEDINYTIIKGSFEKDNPTKKFDILKQEFHIFDIETDIGSARPIKGYAEYAIIDKGIYNGQVEFDDYSFFPCNKGNLIYEENTFYSGDYSAGKRHGEGIYFAYKTESKIMITEGKFFNDQLTEGRIYNDIVNFKDQDKRDEKYFFDGKFEDNKFKYGTMIYENGDKYVGAFSLNKRNGEGAYYYLNGSYFEGNWKNNLKHGKGKYYDKANDMTVHGEWENNKIENLFHKDIK